MPQGPENCQLASNYFVGAQTVVSLLQTTQIKQSVSFLATNKVYTSTNKNHNRLNRDRTLFFLFFLPGVDASHVYVGVLALGCFCRHISTPTFRRALTASLHGQLRGDKECPFSGVTTEFGGRCRKAMLGVMRPPEFSHNTAPVSSE